MCAAPLEPTVAGSMDHAPPRTVKREARTLAQRSREDDDPPEDPLDTLQAAAPCKQRPRRTQTRPRQRRHSIDTHTRYPAASTSHACCRSSATAHGGQPTCRRDWRRGRRSAEAYANRAVHQARGIHTLYVGGATSSAWCVHAVPYGHTRIREAVQWTLCMRPKHMYIQIDEKKQVWRPKQHASTCASRSQ